MPRLQGRIADAQADVILATILAFVVRDTAPVGNRATARVGNRDNTFATERPPGSEEAGERYTFALDVCIATA